CRGANLFRGNRKVAVFIKVTYDAEPYKLFLFRNSRQANLPDEVIFQRGLRRDPIFPPVPCLVAQGVYGYVIVPLVKVVVDIGLPIWRQHPIENVQNGIYCGTLRLVFTLRLFGGFRVGGGVFCSLQKWIDQEFFFERLLKFSAARCNSLRACCSWGVM